MDSAGRDYYLPADPNLYLCFVDSGVKRTLISDWIDYNRYGLAL